MALVANPLTWLLDTLARAGSSTFFNGGGSAAGTGRATLGSWGRLLARQPTRLAGPMAVCSCWTGWPLPPGAPRVSSRSRTRAGSSANIQLPDSASPAADPAGHGPESRRSPARTAGGCPHGSRFRAFPSCCQGRQSQLRVHVRRPGGHSTSGGSSDLSDTAIMARLRSVLEPAKSRTPRWSPSGAPAIPGLSVAGRLQAHG